MQTPPTPWRAMRESVPDLSLREVSRRTGINSGRLSVIERGLVPTDEEAATLRRVLIEAMSTDAARLARAIGDET